MHAQGTNAIRLDNRPVALLWSSEYPVAATEFKERTWGSAMWFTAPTSQS